MRQLVAVIIGQFEVKTESSHNPLGWFIKNKVSSTDWYTCVANSNNPRILNDHQLMPWKCCCVLNSTFAFSCDYASVFASLVILLIAVLEWPLSSEFNISDQAKEKTSSKAKTPKQSNPVGGFLARWSAKQSLFEPEEPSPKKSELFVKFTYFLHCLIRH